MVSDADPPLGRAAAGPGHPNEPPDRAAKVAAAMANFFTRWLLWSPRTVAARRVTSMNGSTSRSLEETWRLPGEETSADSDAEAESATAVIVVRAGDIDVHRGERIRARCRVAGIVDSRDPAFGEGLRVEAAHPVDLHVVALRLQIADHRISGPVGGHRAHRVGGGGRPADHGGSRRGGEHRCKEERRPRHPPSLRRAPRTGLCF